MKKLVAITVALALALTLALTAIPASANGPIDVGTGVDVSGGTTTPPIVKCKWEQDITTDLEDGDILHQTPGAQFLPPAVFGGTKVIQYWAVVTDPEGVSTVKTVSAEVYHPAGPPENGSKKYQVIMEKVSKFDVGLPAYRAARAAGLVMYGPGYGGASPYEPPCMIPNPTDPTLPPIPVDQVIDPATGEIICTDDIWYELDKCTAEVYMGWELIDYHQPAGDYRVVVDACDNGNAWAGQATPPTDLENYFTYLPVAAFEIDFNSLTYGTVSVCNEKWVAGDTVFQNPYPDAAPVPNPASVRNIGNVDIQLTVEQTDMGFGYSGTPPTAYSGQVPPAVGASNWNVVFDARLGSDPANAMYYDPEVEVTLPNKLPLCNTEELDFSIHIIKSTSGSHDGTLTIGCVKVPF
jgi:hypothetical protein